jgi:formamidopyrimidine-DNA glycosylase
MPELPEIYNLAIEMNTALSGKTIRGIEVLQPKCLNMEPDEFAHALTGAQIREVRYRGKWIFVDTTQGWLLLSLGMGGEILLVDRAAMPEKWRLAIDFVDDTTVAINFWWFGYAHFVNPDELDQHKMTAKLGPNAIDLTAVDLKALFAGQRSRLKSFLLDQSRIAGIGNAYIHDILFFARLHPLRAINTLSESDIDALALSIQKGLQPAIRKGGAFYEKRLNGENGGFLMEDVVIGYREGEPCPNCATPIEKIKTGGTSSFICPTCQPMV